MSEFWILVVILVVGFILTWIICSKMPESSDLESKPGGVMFINSYDAEKESLKVENYTLRKKLFSAEREIDYLRGGRYGWDLDAMRKILEKPVEVNVDVNIQNS